jgi:hypothetical protein
LRHTQRGPESRFTGNAKNVAARDVLRLAEGQ